MDKKTCGTCQHHDPCPWYGSGYCMREDSSYFQEETLNTAHCSAWEPQETDQDEAAEVRMCPSEDCPLWDYRMGHRPKEGQEQAQPPTSDAVFDDAPQG